MGFKKFLMKKTLQMKGVSKEQAEAIATELDENPALTESMKSLQKNPELKALFEKIQKEVDEKKKGGMPEAYASIAVMTKYKSEIAKYRDELAPLANLMMGGK
jgi:cell fate (sporulation/competence/biofilm development) regulator YlbF (YheA/YmcA/DUF963 family)